MITDGHAASPAIEQNTNGIPTLVPPEQKQSFHERIQQLRAAGDAAGVARLLLERAGTNEERAAVRLRPTELKLLKEMKSEWRKERMYREASKTLAWLRDCGEVYRLAYLVTRSDELYKDLVSGTNLPSGVSRFELNENELAAVRLREERGFDRGDHLLEWKYLGSGSYETLDGRWSIMRWGFNEWWLYWDDEAVGGWGFQTHWPFNRKYFPFESVWAAKEWAKEHPNGDEEDEEDEEENEEEEQV